MINGQIIVKISRYRKFYLRLLSLNDVLLLVRLCAEQKKNNKFICLLVLCEQKSTYRLAKHKRIFLKWCQNLFLDKSEPSLVELKVFHAVICWFSATIHLSLFVEKTQNAKNMSCNKKQELFDIWKLLSTSLVTVESYNAKQILVFILSWVCSHCSALFDLRTLNDTANDSYRKQNCVETRKVKPLKKLTWKREKKNK